MKRIVLSALVALCSTLLPPFTASGQSSIYHVPTQTGDTTIVREWQEGYYVTYNREPHCFSLHDPGNTNILTIPVPDPNALVRDFRILNDSIFAGGSYVTGGLNIGFLACFSIQDFYTGAGSFKGGYYQPTPMPDVWSTPPFYNLITNIRRLTLFKDEHGIKVAFIADNAILDNSGVVYERVGIGSAQWNDPAFTWDTTPLLYNKDGIEEYTDIIATDNYVVAVSRTIDSALLNIRTFDIQSFLPNSSIQPYWINTYRQCVNDQNVIGRVMATPVSGDKFEVVYHYKKQQEFGVAIKEFTIGSWGWLNYSQGANIPISGGTSSSWEMRDVRYLPDHNYIAALQYVYASLSGNPENIVHFYDQGNLPSYFGRYLSGYKLHALDKLGNDKFITTGHHLGSLHIYTENPNCWSSCGSYDFSWGYKVTNIKIYNYRMPGSMNSPTPPSFPVTITAFEENRYMDCEHSQKQENTEKE